MDAATFAGPPSRGSFAAIFGSGLAPETAVAPSIPLPTSLRGVEVTIDGIPAPILFVGPLQINVQVPFGADNDDVTVVVRNAAGEDNLVASEIKEASPGIWTVNQMGSGQGWILFANTRVVAAPAGALAAFRFESRPAREGDLLTIFASGLGEVEPPIEDGHNSCEPDGVCLADGSNVDLRTTDEDVKILIAGEEIEEDNILFSGLSPPFVALYQVNFILPENVPPGDAVPIQIEVQRSGAVFTSSGAATLAIE